MRKLFSFFFDNSHGLGTYSILHCQLGDDIQFKHYTFHHIVFCAQSTIFSSGETGTVFDTDGVVYLLVKLLFVYRFS